jgi:hypothetical protein
MMPRKAKKERAAELDVRLKALLDDALDMVERRERQAGATFTVKLADEIQQGGLGTIVALVELLEQERKAKAAPPPSPTPATSTTVNIALAGQSFLEAVRGANLAKHEARAIEHKPDDKAD